MPVNWIVLDVKEPHWYTLTAGFLAHATSVAGQDPSDDILSVSQLGNNFLKIYTKCAVDTNLLRHGYATYKYKIN
jgi:hypothetical protein